MLLFSDEVEPINIDPIDANRPETSSPVNMPSAIKHGSVPVRNYIFLNQSELSRPLYIQWSTDLVEKFVTANISIKWSFPQIAVSSAPTSTL